MKVIIAGSRELPVSSVWLIIDAIARNTAWDITEVVSGTARGVDQFGETWAESCKTPITRFPADWDKHGRGAGYIRNREMADYADALIAIWDGKSKGTKNMIEEARKRNLPVFLVTIQKF